MNNKIISKHFFSSLVIKNNNGYYDANFKESVKNIEGLRITSLAVKNFISINQSMVYYLIVDIGATSNAIFTINTQPSRIAFSVTNLGNGNNISRYDESAVFTKIASQQLYGFKFYLADETLKIINPADLGWSFNFSLEFIHFQDEQSTFNK